MSDPGPADAAPVSDPALSLDGHAIEAPVDGGNAALEARRERLRRRAGGSLRNFTAGGMAVNAVWSIGLQGLAFMRGMLVAIFLAPSDYGVWSIIVLGYTALGRLKQVGIGDKYIQQDDPDDEAAFQKAFTLEAIMTTTMVILLAAATPLLALIYRAPQIVAPGLVLLVSLLGGIFQTPVWAYTRDMDFRRQRRLSAVDPIMGVLGTVVSAAAGLGYWSFAIGSFVGAWSGAIAVMRNAPYPIRLRYDRGTAREYVRFSWPLLLTNLSNTVLIQTTTLFARASVGFAGLGAMSLSNSGRLYTEFADGIISGTMYPAVCAVKDRVDLMHESFVKSNRLALMWGVPLGVGVALFAGDLLRYVFGEEWAYATLLFQSVGLVSAIGHIGFNWDDYLRATGNTKPIAKYAWIGLIGWGIGPLPLMLLKGLDGYAVGLFVVSAVTLTTRGYFIRRLFPGFSLLPHCVRALAPTVPAVAAVLLLRIAEPFDRSLLVAIGELIVYLAVTVVATWLAEKTLLREAISYLRKSRAPQVQLAT